MKQRRALAIARALLRVGTDEPIEIARLELGGITRKRGDVAHPIVARTALEEISERERRQGGVAPCTAAADHDAFLINPPLRNEISGAIDAVVDIHDAPAEMQALAIGAAEARAAAIVDIE